MREPWTELYVHLVWSCWDRQPLISSEIEGRLYAGMQEACRNVGCECAAIGGTADHVHLLVRMGPTVSVSELVKRVKGSSSHLATYGLGSGFQWQGAYGDFTVGKGDVAEVGSYVRNQKSRHAGGLVDGEMERMGGERVRVGPGE